MVRRHGWQLPAHTFQIMAITVFLLLAVAFYAFMAPFLGSDRLEHAAIMVYTPIVFCVFLLYIRCSAIDPSDTGIFTNSDQKCHMANRNIQYLPRASGLNLGQTERNVVSLPSTGSSFTMQSNNVHNLGERGKATINGSDKKGFSSLLNACMCLLCGWVYKDDNCQKCNSCPHEPSGQDALFCTMCNAEVRNKSKHCRSCDKCVDGFDHHCRWLNNCVGKKNYRSFFVLMAFSLTWLLLEGGIGIAVLVRCFSDKREISLQIVDKLGNSFSRVSYMLIVVFCTVVALIASLPLVELFFFHIILIKKGITTYEYVIAMRSLSEAPTISADGDEQSVPSSPMGSTVTGLSRASSRGLQYRGAWCTPPRIFVEHQQDEVIPHLGPGQVPSTIDPDNIVTVNKAQKRSVRISAWKLARLNPEEAIRAMEKAKASSSILRPVVARGAPDVDYSSLETVSSRSSLSKDFPLSKEAKLEKIQSPLKYSYTPSQTSKEDNESSIHSFSSYNSPSYLSEVAKSSHLTPEQRLGVTRSVQSSSAWGYNGHFLMGPNMRCNLPLYSSSIIEPYSSCSPFPGNIHESHSHKSSQTANSGRGFRQIYSNQLFRNSRFSGRSSVFWDQDAGRYISFPLNVKNENDTCTLSPLQTCNSLSLHHTVQNNLSENEYHEDSGPRGIPFRSTATPELDLPSSATGHLRSSALSNSFRLNGNLLCNGESIFFGGPLSVPLTGKVKTGNSQSASLSIENQNQGSSQEPYPLHCLTSAESPGNGHPVSSERESYRGSQMPLFVSSSMQATRDSQTSH